MLHPDSTEINHHGILEPLKTWDRLHIQQHTEMLDWLGIQVGSTVLDAGCGTGGMTALLAQRVGPTGRVRAIDISDECVGATEDAIAATASRDWTSVARGDVQSLDFPDAHFDVVWCSRVVHGEPDQLAGVRELRRVLRPGGQLVLREGGQGLTFLPYDIGVGEPGLEGRLLQAQAVFFQRLRSSLLGTTRFHGGWLAMLEEAGLGSIRARAFTLERSGPLESDALAVVLSRLKGAQTHEHLRRELDDSDLATLAVLCDESVPQYIGHRSDLHLISSSALYAGIRSDD